MVVAVKAKWLKTTTELQTCLGVNIKSCFNCQGHSATKSSCGNAISQASRSEMAFVMLDIINCGSLASASAHLERLASLTLCKRSHQAQAGEKATHWKARIQIYLEAGTGDGVTDEKEVKAPRVRPQRTTMITPPSTPVANKRDVRQPVSTRSSQRTAAPPPPVTPRRATRAPRGSASSIAVLIEEDLGDNSEEDDSEGEYSEEDSEEDSEEGEKYYEPEPVRSQTRRAPAPAPSVKWEPNGKAGFPYPYPSQTKDRENLEYKLAKAQAELAVYEAWVKLRKFE
ncbi:hypothetical protein CaCOL14_005343 [Colletotrichum acutatum]|uniref:Uncharacterized protein n=1 Tax=Glomerella acutata TaxID=27357 RepID=A0AAD8XK28_GLOAC|nr:uncharacterized protein BDZ83DRAFT_648477 [Colletotrichum acutatum]KAK1728826.1 hypothetical protein BDZ83DRAFT_648477 [Colletotrichum acutatum]